jgi:prepilin-type N-terminal cleavage/methylation domain-containing protein
MKPHSHIVRRDNGFSLLEMMIAVVILGVITAQLFVALTAQRSSNRGQAVGVDTQEATRSVLDLISFETRNAGMLIPREVAVASTDGGSNGVDRFCISDGTIFQPPPPTPPGTPPVQNGYWNKLADTLNGATGQATAGNTTLALNTVNIETTVQPGSGVDITQAGGTSVDFALDHGIIVANGTRDPNGNWLPSDTNRMVFCARVRQVTGNTVVIDTSLPSQFTAPRLLTAVPAIIYEIGPDPINPAQTALLRNNVAITTQIEDLQVQYWVDSAPTNGSIDGNEWPLDRLDGQDTARIRRVRIYALGRTQVEQAAGGDGTALARHHHPGMANRIAGTQYDNFEREVFVASVLPRNLFDYLGAAGSSVPNVP